MIRPKHHPPIRSITYLYLTFQSLWQGGLLGEYASNFKTCFADDSEADPNTTAFLEAVDIVLRDGDLRSQQPPTIHTLQTSGDWDEVDTNTVYQEISQHLGKCIQSGI